MAQLKITHDHEHGTVLHGSDKNDGVLEIVSEHGFTWRHWAGIHIRGSRDRMAKTWKINAAAAALRDAGHDVEIGINNTPRPTEVVEAERADRAEERADRLTTRSEKANTEGDARLAARRRITDGIPFGQPVQPPGHHSRNAHLNALDRAENHHQKAIEAWRKGEYLGDRARGVIAHQKHRVADRTTMRRIETLQTEKRDINRKLEGYTRNFRNNQGEIYHVETNKPATGEWREQLQTQLAQVDDQIAHWQGQLDAKAESGEFVPWGAEHFTKSDWVNVSGRWCEVARVNRKSASVRALYDWQTSEHTETVTWDAIFGRRRDGMQWDAPNAEPWPVERARKVARWRNLRCSGNEVYVAFAQRIALGLGLLAADAEVEAFLVLVDDLETSRRVREAFVDIYDRLTFGEKATDVQASVTPLDLEPEWRMPDREPEDRIAHRSIFARHDFAAVQAGDLIVGWFDSGRGTPLRRGFCGPVAKVSEVNNRREAGEWITITLVDGQEMTCQTHRWFQAHPAGTWENTEQTGWPDISEPLDADLAEKVDRYHQLRRPEHEAHMARQRHLAADADKAEAFAAELDAWAERDAQIAESVFGGHLVRSAEIAEVQQGRPVFDGCTSVYLGERYGDRVRHVQGVGWFLDLPTADAGEPEAAPRRLVARRVPEVGAAVFDADTDEKVSPAGDAWWPNLRRAREALAELQSAAGPEPAATGDVDEAVAEAAGRAAYAEGRPAAPGADAAVMRLVEGMAVGEGAAAIFAAFTRGFGAAADEAAERVLAEPEQPAGEPDPWGETLDLLGV